MLIDTFLYAGEADMLELRLRTLWNAVDRFVAVESPVTHQGEKAHRHLEPSDRWKPYLPKLRAYRQADYPTTKTRGGVGTDEYQQIERWHRNTMRGAALTQTDDYESLVMCSDVDEIPNPHVIADRLQLLDRMGRHTPWLVLEQRFHSTALDLLHPQQPWLGTCISRLRDLRPQAMRDARGDLHAAGQVVKDAGWHLSWFGTDDERQQKLDSFSHAELRGRFDPAAARALREHANGEPLRLLSHEEMARSSWPTPITDGTFAVPAWWWADAA